MARLRSWYDPVEYSNVDGLLHGDFVQVNLMQSLWIAGMELLDACGDQTMQAASIVLFKLLQPRHEGVPCAAGADVVQGGSRNAAGHNFH